MNRFLHDAHRFPFTLASEETKQNYAKFIVSVYWLFSVRLSGEKLPKQNET